MPTLIDSNPPPEPGSGVSNAPEPHHPGPLAGAFGCCISPRQMRSLQRETADILFGSLTGTAVISELGRTRIMRLRDYLILRTLLEHLTSPDIDRRIRAHEMAQALAIHLTVEEYAVQLRPLIAMHCRDLAGELTLLARLGSCALQSRLDTLSPAELWFMAYFCRDALHRLGPSFLERFEHQLDKVGFQAGNFAGPPDYHVLVERLRQAHSLLHVSREVRSLAGEWNDIVRHRGRQGVGVSRSNEPALPLPRRKRQSCTADHVDAGARPEHPDSRRARLSPSVRTALRS